MVESYRLDNQSPHRESAARCQLIELGPRFALGRLTRGTVAGQSRNRAATRAADPDLALGGARERDAIMLCGLPSRSIVNWLLLVALNDTVC